MSFYTSFDWFKKLVIFICTESENRRCSQGVACCCHQAIFLNEAPLRLFKFNSDYLPYFEKINIFFNIITKKI